METREELRQRVRTEQEIIARLKTAAVRFADSQTERAWAIVSAHRAGLSIRKIALATGLSSSRTHQLLKEVDASEIPEWLSRARESNLQIFAEGNRKRSSRESRVRAQVATEITMLRQCIDWLEQLDRGERVIVNLRSETDVETEFVSFDRQRVLKVLKRIVADLDDLAQNAQRADCAGDNLDPQTRHRRQLAEPPPKGLSDREQRAALRSKLGLPPKR